VHHFNATIMKKFNKYIYCCLVTTVILQASSCSKFLEVETPVGEVSSSTVFNSESSAQAAVVGLYSQVMVTNNYFLNGGLSLYGGLYADELYNTSANSNYDPFKSSSLTSANSIVSNNLYRFAYNYIYQANLILENLPEARISDNNKLRYTGEMFFMRSLCYFYLVNLWGDVPLILSTDQEVNRIATRTNKLDIYKQLISDLLQAEIQLKDQSTDVEKSRPDLYAVKLLLSRAYLYQKDYRNAFAKADEVIQSGKYSLEQDLTKVFLAGSKETILQFRPLGPNFNTAEGFTFLPSSSTASPTISLFANWMKTFESTDQRQTQWVTKRTSGSVNYYFPAKYKIRSNAVKTEFNIALRLAEAYLIRSESNFRLNNYENAITDLNVIRKRAGLTDLPLDLPANQYEETLMQERSHEFFAEWGHRWLDLKRWDKAAVILSSVKTEWNAYKELFPIPNYEIIRNTKMTQNEGYND